MYKYYTEIEDMKVMRELEPDSLTKLKRRGALRSIRLGPAQDAPLALILWYVAKIIQLS